MVLSQFIAFINPDKNKLLVVGVQNNDTSRRSGRKRANVIKRHRANEQRRNFIAMCIRSRQPLVAQQPQNVSRRKIKLAFWRTGETAYSLFVCDPSAYSSIDQSTSNKLYGNSVGVYRFQAQAKTFFLSKKNYVIVVFGKLQ